MSSIEVRDIQEGDYDEWVRLFNLYLEFYKVSLPEETKKHTFERFLNPEIDMWSAVAIHPETGKIIGIANYLKHMYTWNSKDKIYLNDLYVDEEQRLKHVGRSLIEYVFKKADERGDICDVYWCTDMTNHRAQLLYTKVGYNAGKFVYKRPKN